MPVIIDGTNGVNTPNTFAFKNRIIDGGFIINQRGYVSGTSLSSGSYGHDRWKGGASGGTYTFTQASAGVNTTITITAGSIIQVIEGANLPEGGTYVLSWTGTAQGKIGSGSFGASGITGTITAGTNTNIEFNTGTCGNVQLEVGSTATSFDYRPYGTELALCQRYAIRYAGEQVYELIGIIFTESSTSTILIMPLPVFMRTTPSVSFSTLRIVENQGASAAVTAVNTKGSEGGNKVAFLNPTVASGLTASRSGWISANNSTSAFLLLSAEL